MPTSDDGHYTRFDESLLDDGDFCDTGMMKRCVGNLDHLADQCSQNRVKWILPGGVSALVVDTDLTVSVDTYYSDEGPALVLWRSLAFDMHVRETGNTYVCRVRLCFHSAHATHKATLRAVLAPVGFSDAELAVNGVNVATSTPTAGTALAWEDLSTLIYLDGPRVRTATTGVSTVDSIGGEERLATWLRVELVIVGSVANVGAAASLGGVELTEYLPPP